MRTPVVGPRSTISGGAVGYGELSGGVEGVCTEVYRVAEEAMIGGYGGSGGPGSEVVERQLSHGEELVP